MGRIKKIERQTAFGLRTDHMSEKVYNHLEKKARSKRLASYIIQLVEQDLTKQEPFNAKAELMEVARNQEHMMKTMEQLTREISTIQVAPVSTVFMPNQKNTKSSLEDDLVKGIGKMGQLITNTTVTGSLDDDDLEDIDF
ncbi:hypothetical protein [Bacillus cereus]|uniref:hypothetical protein n=1 Tax=Bacillus cereus TaxID=1396 RepID=UPI000BEC0C71|nr:hypothetical protein [Bacillus cereus]PEF61885.1 hypothetical protein CON35_22965 [Bacillus cereus]